MASDDGEHTTTRFPCLAWLRTSVAIVVTVLVLVLLVMVITDVRRPEKISLSSYGYVQTMQPWWSETTTTTKIRNKPLVLGRARARPSPPVAPPLELMPATMVTMWVNVLAYNPSGRGHIDCNITTISIIDMPYDDFRDMVEIKRYSPESPEFSVPPQTWHRDIMSVNINNSVVLSHLVDVHQKYSFRVMVQVNTTYKAQHSTKSVNVSHFCWPVTFIYTYGYANAVADVPCKTSEEMDYSVSWSTG